MPEQIPLRGRDGEIRAWAIVDLGDFKAIARYPWHLGTDGYAVRSTRLDGRVRVIGMHRDVLGLALGDALQADHINRNKLDNRRANLRVLTDAENKQNRPSCRGATSRFRGVYWNARQQKWHARIGLRGRKHHLGFFTDEVEAAQACAEFLQASVPFAVPDPELAKVG